MNADQIIAHCLPIVAKVPIDERGRRSWQQAPDVAGTIAALLIKYRPNMTVVARGLGIPGCSLSDFVHGCGTNGTRCHAIVGILKREGVEPIVGKYHSGERAIVPAPAAIGDAAAPLVLVDAPASLPGVRAVTKWIDDTGAEHGSPEGAAMASKRAKTMQAARALSDTHVEHKDFVRAIMEHGDLVIALAEAIKSERDLEAVLAGRAAAAA